MFKKFFVAKGNEQEALLVEGIEVYAIATLSELIDFLQGKIKLKPAKDKRDYLKICNSKRILLMCKGNF